VRHGVLGLALARGPNYNEWEIDANREKIAAEAIKKARALERGAGASEQAYIHAMEKRVSANGKADQKTKGANYRDAMRNLMKRYPDDLDVAECLHAKGKAAEEGDVRKEFQEGWKHAETELRMEDL
jgi:hypothetical protein